MIRREFLQLLAAAPLAALAPWNPSRRLVLRYVGDGAASRVIPIPPHARISASRWFIVWGEDGVPVCVCEPKKQGDA